MKATLEIQNLKCGGCAHTISTKLSNLDNISDVMVDPETDSVSFDYTNEEDFKKVKTILSKLGYPIIGENNPLTKKAKSFVSCAVGRLNS